MPLSEDDSPPPSAFLRCVMRCLAARSSVRTHCTHMNPLTPRSAAQAEDAGWRSLGRPAGRAWRAAPPRRRGYALKAVQGKTGGDDWEMTP